jgi:hypothetical protein
MRARLLTALLLAAAAAAGACAPRSQPYRFAMPMLGQADVPGEALGPAAGGDVRQGSDTQIAGRASPGQPSAGRDAGPDAGRDAGRDARPSDAPRTVYAYGWQKDAQSGIRTETASGIELKQPEASDAGALAVTQQGLARTIATSGVITSRLPAPNRDPSNPRNGVVASRLPAPNRDAPSGVTSAVDLPRLQSLREPAGLRALVGTRDKRDPFTVAMGWLAELGVTFVDPGSAIDMATQLANKPSDGPALVAWASARGKLFGPSEAPVAGDVLVFDRATANAEADLIAIVVGRDARGVIEMIYAGGGVIRRGFVDPSQPSTRRDFTGSVINTFLRHGKQWPPKGTRYLAGELLSHVIRVH